MTRLSPVALLDLTRLDLSVLASGLGTSGWRETLLVPGRELGPVVGRSDRVTASASSRLMLNLGSWSDLVCLCLDLLPRLLSGLGDP